jgi:hypothetical protein
MSCSMSRCATTNLSTEPGLSLASLSVLPRALVSIYAMKTHLPRVQCERDLLASGGVSAPLTVSSVSSLDGQVLLLIRAALSRQSLLSLENRSV